MSHHSYDENVATIKKVKFGVLSPEKILETSVCEVYKKLQGTDNYEGTISDPRLGTTDHYKICQTCDNNYYDCTGHFGHITLAVPIILPQYYMTILKILDCVCFKCSAVLIDDKEAILKKPRKSRYKYISLKKSPTRAKNCSRCNAIQPYYHKDNKYCQAISYYYKDATVSAKASSATAGAVVENGGTDESKYHRLSNDIIYGILKGITPIDAELCGIENPHHMMWTVMPVPPMSMRPSVKTDDGKVSDDDLTHKLNDIVGCNQGLQELMKSDKVDSNKCYRDYVDLQNNITTYIDNTISSVKKAKHRSGRPIKSIRQRVGGKDGRYRSSLMGKRVDYSGRSVVTPDPNLSIDQVGVPEYMAKIITYPEVVNRYNIDKLSKMLLNGPTVYPGVKSVQVKGSKLRQSTKSEKVRTRPLVYGDIVYRHLCNNDIIIFNRQPSLHKMSMMAHYVYVTKRKTLTMNQNVTSPYNGDFDGDEFNMHVPQSIITVTETFMLALSSTQIISPQKHGPVIGFVQDSILGLYLATRHNEPIPYDICMSFIGRIKRRFTKIPKPDLRDSCDQPLWYIKSILNIAIPPVNYNTYKPARSDSGQPEKGIEITNGVIGRGVFTKNELSAKEGSIFHIIFLDYGPIVTKDTMDNLSFIANEWFRIYGYSANIYDCEVSPEIENTRIRLLNECDERVEEIIHEVSCVKKTEKRLQVINDRIMKEVGEVRDAVIKEIMKDTDKKAIFRMIESGSKGKDDNMGQMIGLLGLQILDNHWITGGFYRRTLPHTTKDSIDPYSHGYVDKSFKTGLDVDSYYFHTASGREGVISKGIKTAETGYIQRKLTKVFEGVSVYYDGSVRNENGIILQQVYGILICSHMIIMSLAISIV